MILYLNYKDKAKKTKRKSNFNALESTRRKKKTYYSNGAERGAGGGSHGFHRGAPVEKE